jgi:hypothetical protein
METLSRSWKRTSPRNDFALRLELVWLMNGWRPSDRIVSASYRALHFRALAPNGPRKSKIIPAASILMPFDPLAATLTVGSAKTELDSGGEFFLLCWLLLQQRKLRPLQCACHLLQSFASAGNPLSATASCPGRALYTACCRPILRDSFALRVTQDWESAFTALDPDLELSLRTRTSSIRINALLDAPFGHRPPKNLPMLSRCSGDGTNLFSVVPNRPRIRRRRFRLGGGL